MKLNVKAMAVTGAALWAVAVLVVGLCNLAFPEYGSAFLRLVDSLYPGYHFGEGLGSVLVGTGYAVVDGGVGGALFAWLYNRCVR